MNPSATAGWLRGLRATLLALAGALEGLLLSSSPVIEGLAAVRLGPDGILIDITFLCVAVLATAGVLAALVPWMQAIFLALIVASTSWSLAESGQHPFWIFSNKGVWQPQPPSMGVLASHIVALGLICSATIVQALHAYRQAAREQAMEAHQIKRDSNHLVAAGALMLAITTFVVLPLIIVLNGAVDSLAKALQGRATLLVLLGSILLLLTGFGLLASPAATVRNPGAR